MTRTFCLMQILFLIPVMSRATPLFNVTDFSGSSTVQLVGNASLSGTKLRITKSLTSQTSAAWLKTPQDITQSFTTTLSFTIGSPIVPGHNWPNGADGLALVIQNDPRTPLNTVLGGTSNQLGYGGNSVGPGVAIQRSLAVAVRTTQYQEIQLFSNGDNPDMQISWDSPDYQFGTPPLARQNGSLATILDTPQNLTLNYDANTQSVTVLLNNQSIGIDSIPLGKSLASLMESNTAIFGITSATGGGYATTDITSFTAASVPEPAHVAIISSTFALFAGRRKNRRADRIS